MLKITEDNDMIVTDEDGNETLLKILFYFHNDQRGKDYYFLYDEATPEEVMVMASEDGESLQQLSEEEFDEAEQVFEAYESDPQIAALKEDDGDED